MLLNLIYLVVRHKFTMLSNLDVHVTNANGGANTERIVFTAGGRGIIVGVGGSSLSGGRNSDVFLKLDRTEVKFQGMVNN